MTRLQYNAELHNKILGFLMQEWARKEHRQLVGVDLFYARGNGFRDEEIHEEIRRWERADEPELFADFANVEKLISQIVEIAEREATAKPIGRHRFVVRTRQYLGGRANCSFALNGGDCQDDGDHTSDGGHQGLGDREPLVWAASFALALDRGSDPAGAARAAARAVEQLREATCQPLKIARSS